MKDSVFWFYSFCVLVFLMLSHFPEIYGCDKQEMNILYRSGLISSVIYHFDFVIVFFICDFLRCHISVSFSSLKSQILASVKKNFSLSKGLVDGFLAHKVCRSERKSFEIP